MTSLFYKWIFFNSSDYNSPEKKLGEGSFGIVYMIRNLKDNQEYAAKMIKDQDNFDGKEQMLFLRESVILH